MSARRNSWPVAPAFRRRLNSAFILIVVLVVITMLSLAGYGYTELMHAEHRAAVTHGRQVQSQALADSGVEFLKAFLSQDEETQQSAGGRFDNPGKFQMIPVLDSDDAVDRGRFTIVAPAMTSGVYGGARFGVEDESTKLNLATVVSIDEAAPGSGRTLLMALPGMTEDIADSILDWLDADDEPREFGAEVDYYSGLDPAYAPKNGPLDTVEELLLVKGMTPALLFGMDFNRNGGVDDDELQNALGSEMDNSDGLMDRGWSAYVTLYSLEKNLRPDGTPKIDLNSDDLQQLYTDLTDAIGEPWAKYIVALRQSGPYTGAEKPQPATSSGGELDLTRGSKYQLTQVLDLIGKNVEVQYKGEEDTVVLETPFADSPLVYGNYLPVLMENVAVNAQPTIPGRININQAPRAVLLGIPGMEETLVDELLNQRTEDGGDDPNAQFETWPLAAGLVTLDQMKQMIPFVCARGNVFRAQVVGYFDGGGPAARVEAVIDMTGAVPRMVSWRDISHLGRGYSLDFLGAELAE